MIALCFAIAGALGLAHHALRRHARTTAMLDDVGHSLHVRRLPGEHNTEYLSRMRGRFLAQKVK